jgi:glycosyltransferase involved in cell wall biosynthesis
MKVLIVCSGNIEDFNFKRHRPFIADQVEAIEKIDSSIKFFFYFIKGKGIIGYLKNIRALKRKIKTENIDIIHAHFSLSGLLCCLQQKAPVVVTFHGSDINLKKNYVFSPFIQLLSKQTIFVSEQLYKKAFLKNNAAIIPCGVDIDVFKPLNKNLCKNSFNLDHSKLYILFSSSFSNSIKNYHLLKEALSLINNENLVVIELKNFTRIEVAKLMNAVDLCVLTSFSEGSPQFIKESMACNRPIVATNVGDISWLFGNELGCYFSEFNADDLKNKILLAFSYSEKFKNTTGRERMISLGLDSESTAKRIIEIYKKVKN